MERGFVTDLHTSIVDFAAKSGDFEADEVAMAIDDLMRLGIFAGDECIVAWNDRAA
jgi:hypothetical protein